MPWPPTQRDRTAGRLAGRSPDQVFAAHVEDGWGRTDIAEADLLAAFCRKEVRVVAKGAISFNGRSYYDDRPGSAAGWAAGSRSASPDRPGAGRIAVWDARGTFLCAAAPDRPYAHDDRSGAVEAGRRRKVAQARVAELRRDIVPIDGVALLRDEAARSGVGTGAGALGRDPVRSQPDQGGPGLAETPSRAAAPRSRRRALLPERDRRDASKTRGGRRWRPLTPRPAGPALLQ